jgi:hypothetical protein
LFNGFLRRRRKAKGPLDAVKEKVAFRQGRLGRVEKACIGLAGEIHAARAHQAEAVRFRGQEYGEPVHAQGFRQAVGNLLEQAVNVQFRSEVARELQQRAAVIIALAIEEPVHPLLDVVHDRLKQDGGEHNRHHPGAPAVDGRERGAEEIREQGDEAEIHTDNGRRGQGVGNAAAEDDVNIHQPVTHNGIAKGDGQDRQEER